MLRFFFFFCSDTETGKRPEIEMDRVQHENPKDQNQDSVHNSTDWVLTSTHATNSAAR